jgi:hypothetical protein
MDTMRSLPKLSLAILKDTISSTMTLDVSLMEYVKVSPIPISTKRDRTIETWRPLCMDVDVEMTQLVTTSWAEGIMQEWEGDTPTPTPTSMGMVRAVGIIKIKDSRDLCSLLSPTVTVVVGVGEVIMDEEDDTIMAPLHSLLDHLGIEVHLDIIVILQDHLQDHPVSIIVHHHLLGHLDRPDIMVPPHHPQDLMDHVDIVGIMDHPLLLDLDIIGLHLRLLGVVISHLHHHLDVVMGADLLLHLLSVQDLLPLLDMDRDNTDHLLSLQDQDIMDPHLPVDIESIEDTGPRVLIQEVIQDRLESTGLVLVHPLLLDAGARSMLSPVLMDLSPLDIKSMAM